jgi:S-formylglutathione hydrolase FrmB
MMAGVNDAGRLSRRTLLVGGGAAALTAAVGGGVAAEWDNPRFARLRGGCGDTPAIPHSAYTVTRGTLPSRAMGTTMPWALAMPSSSLVSVNLPVVLCLTGLGDGIDAVFTGIGLPGFATELGLTREFAFLVPGGGDDSYWHPRADGRDPLAWAVDECLPAIEGRFHIGGYRNRRAGFGWSMGGFGALLAAQQRPTLFGAVAAMSPAVFPSYDAASGGHSYTFDSAADWERYGLWNHLDDLSGTAVRIDCGDYDPFAPTARELLRRIPDAVGEIGSGCHDAAFWRRTAPASLRFLAGRLQGAV